MSNKPRHKKAAPAKRKSARLMEFQRLARSKEFLPYEKVDNEIIVVKTLLHGLRNGDMLGDQKITEVIQITMSMAYILRDAELFKLCHTGYESLRQKRFGCPYLEAVLDEYLSNIEEYPSPLLLASERMTYSMYGVASINSFLELGVSAELLEIAGGATLKSVAAKYGRIQSWLSDNVKRATGYLYEAFRYDAGTVYFELTIPNIKKHGAWIVQQINDLERQKRARMQRCIEYNTMFMITPVEVEMLRQSVEN